MVDIKERLAALERRVAALEGRPAANKFWALNALRDQLPDGGGLVLFTGVVPLPGGEHHEWQQDADTADLLDRDWPGCGGALAALGNPVRLLLVRQILGGVRTVAELQEHESLGTTGQLYHHLRQLVSAGWLRTTGRGQYSVPGPRVVPLFVILAAVSDPSS